MSSRTQLNVNIKPDLLKALKQNAIKSGMTLSNYVTQLIKVYVSNEDLMEEEDKVSSRIKDIEEKLNDINLKLNSINPNLYAPKKQKASEILGFSKNGTKAFAEAVFHTFQDECKKRNLTLEEGIMSITPHIQSSFNIKYWGAIIEMLAENKTPTADKVYEIYKNHDYTCPMNISFNKWCGKTPQILEDKLMEAAIA